MKNYETKACVGTTGQLACYILFAMPLNKLGNSPDDAINT